MKDCKGNEIVVSRPDSACIVTEKDGLSYKVLFVGKDEICCIHRQITIGEAENYSGSVVWLTKEEIEKYQLTVVQYPVLGEDRNKVSVRKFDEIKTSYGLRVVFDCVKGQFLYEESDNWACRDCHDCTFHSRPIKEKKEKGEEMKEIRRILGHAGQQTSKYPEKKILAGSITFIHATQFDDVAQEIASHIKDHAKLSDVGCKSLPPPINKEKK